jgi:hypothetical protein
LRANISAPVDQQSSHAPLPETRLDKQRVELGIPVWPRQDRSEADDHRRVFCHENVTIRDLLHRDDDRVRVREKRVAIARIGERSAPLQRLQARTLGEQRRADHNI